MTLLDLIRVLHNKGEEVVAYEVFSFLAGVDEDVWLYAARPNGGYAQYLHQVSNIPPEHIALSGDYFSVVAHDAAEYKKLTYGRTPPERGYPRLLLAFMPTLPKDFLKAWKGKPWSSVPCRELSNLDQNGNAVPLLDKRGNIADIVYMGMPLLDENGSYYLVFAKAGKDSASQFVWPYDLSELPDGLSVMDAPEF